MVGYKNSNIMAQPKKKTHAEKAAAAAAKQAATRAAAHATHRHYMSCIVRMLLNEVKSKSIDPIHFLRDMDTIWSAEERLDMSRSNQELWTTIVAFIKTENYDVLRWFYGSLDQKGGH
jgi:hypothetical protein